MTLPRGFVNSVSEFSIYVQGFRPVLGPELFAGEKRVPPLNNPSSKVLVMASGSTRPDASLATMSWPTNT